MKRFKRATLAVALSLGLGLFTSLVGTTSAAAADYIAVSRNRIDYRLSHSDVVQIYNTSWREHWMCSDILRDLDNSSIYVASPRPILDWSACAESLRNCVNFAVRVGAYAVGIVWIRDGVTYTYDCYTYRP